MRHGMDDGMQIEIHGDVIGEGSGNEGEDVPAMETAQTRGADRDATRRPSGIASDHSMWFVRMSRLVRSRRRQVGYAAYRGRRSSHPSTTKEDELAEYRGASESAKMIGIEESTGAESMPLSK
jgi:hypothetical protein